MLQQAPVVELIGVSKRFGAVRANRNVSFAVYGGQIHALVGENGAGKTTLMRILYGMLSPDEGSVVFDGKPTRLASPRDALAAGVVMVQQNFALVDELTVAENVVLGSEPAVWRCLLDKRTASQDVHRLASRLGVTMDPTTPVRHLSAGMRQRVEILKALYRGARVLILDEPTSLLGPRETEELFTVMRELAAAGTGIVYISHRVKEVLRISDTITLLRKGEKVAELTPSDTTAEQLSSLMAGGKTTGRIARSDRPRGAVVLSVEHTSAASARGIPMLTDVSLHVSTGEVLGIAAVEGNGARELVEVVTGLRTPTSGVIRFQESGRHRRTADLQAFVGFMPESAEWGSVDELSLAENVLLGREREPAFAHRGVLRREALNDRCRVLLDRFSIVPPDPRLRAGALSGGNRQRLVAARELDRRPSLLVAAHPTKGLDVAGTGFVHNCIIAERNRGCAILLVSSDLEELLALSDRIAVLFRGSVAAALVNEDLRETDIVPYMTGARNGGMGAREQRGGGAEGTRSGSCS